MWARAMVVLVLTGALLTGCLSDGSCATVLGPSPAAASCVSAVEYDGRTNVAWTDRIPAVRGDLLGDAAYPSCNDTGCTDEEDPRPTRVWTLRGVDTDQLVVGRLEGMRRWVVYALPSADPRDWFRRVGGRWELRATARG